MNQSSHGYHASIEPAAYGNYRHKQLISTLSPGFSGENSCAAIHLLPAGAHLYATNGGHDSIAVFAVDEGSGSFTAVGPNSALGYSPRNSTHTSKGKFLLVANQDSDTIIGFPVDHVSGELQPVAIPTDVATRVRLKWLLQKLGWFKNPQSRV